MPSVRPCIYESILLISVPPSETPQALSRCLDVCYILNGMSTSEYRFFYPVPGRPQDACKKFLYASTSYLSLLPDHIPLQSGVHHSQNHEKMFGHTVSTESKEVTMNANDESSYVGTGWVTVEKIDGVRFFTANILVKVKYSEPSEEYSTKGDSIEYKTPSISGRALKEDDGTWKKIKQFDTEKETLDYIYKFFGVTSSQESV